MIYVGIGLTVFYVVLFWCGYKAEKNHQELKKTWENIRWE